MVKSKLDSSILNNEPDIEGYDLIRLVCLSKEGEVVYYIRKFLSYNHKSIFYCDIESIFFFSCLNQSQFWLECYIISHYFESSLK